MQATTEQIHNLYKAFCNADTEWSLELCRVFGKDACNARYTILGKGEVGSALRTLHDNFDTARDAWHKAVRPQEEYYELPIPPLSQLD